MYSVRGWKDFQHYGDRNPPWIKLHKKLLDDFEFQCLPLASKALAPMLWLLASEHENPKSGFIEGPHERIAFRLHLSMDDFNDAIKPLIDRHFLIPASTPLADCQQDATPETEDRDRGQSKKYRNFKNERKNGHARSGTDEGHRLAEKYRAQARAQNLESPGEG